MFFKEKFNTRGELVKLKARLVAGGHMQDPNVERESMSPTAKVESVLMALALAAAERRHLVAVDIGNAFLESEMTGEEVLIELDAFCCRILATIAPEVTKFLDEKGRMVARLNKALYGCVQSARLWFNHLKGVLLELGYVQNDYDMCVFNREVEGKKITVVVYVDDLLCSCVDKRLLDSFVAELRTKFKQVKVSEYDNFEYLGYEVDNTGAKLQVTMKKFSKLVLHEAGVMGESWVPAETDFLTRDSTSALLGAAEKKRFHSTVARLNYLVKRLRFDFLLCVNVLCSFVTCPTDQDAARLEKILCFLNKTSERGLNFTKGVPVKLECYADAAFGSHAEDGRSRTGVVLLMSGACVGGWSSKQKIVTRSSTEAELVGVNEALTYALWARHWLMGQGYAAQPVRVYQDNKSVLDIAVQEGGPSNRTRHLNVKYFFVREKARGGEVVLEHKASEDMWADTLTKPLTRGPYWACADGIMGKTI